MRGATCGRWALMLAALLAGAPMPASAPPTEGQRLLGKLQQQFKKELDAARFAEAARVARRIETVWTKAQGANYWRTINARYTAERWQRLAGLPDKDSKQVAQAVIHRVRGAGLYARRDYPGAAKAHQQALAVFRRIPGEQHPETAFCYTNVAICLVAMGKHAEAIPFHQKALAIRRKNPGEQHPDTAGSYNNLAACHSAQGKLAEAIPLHRKALQIRKKTLGEHPDTARSYNDLADCLDRQGKVAEALPLFKKALEIRKKTLGEWHYQTATSYDFIAGCLSAQGKQAEALPVYRKALEIIRETLGERHPYTAATYNNTAACLDDLGKHAEALPLHQKALEICQKILGPQHLDTAASYNNVAYCLAKQGKHAEALPLHQQALEICRITLGKDDFRTATCTTNMALCLNAQGKYKDALVLFKKALEIFKKTPGPEHPNTALSYNNVAACLDALGEHAEALPLHKKALEIKKKTLGEQHPGTAVSYNTLAACLVKQGRHAEALPLHNKTLEIDRKVLGEQHPRTALSYSNVAACLTRQGKIREALPYWKAALLGHDIGRLDSAGTGFDRALFGARSASPRAELALGHASLGKAEEAWSYAEQSLARGLLDDLTGAPATANRGQVALLRKVDKRLVPLLVATKLTKDRQALRDELTRQRRDLLKEVSKDLAARWSKAVWSRQDIQKRIPADGAIVFWLDGLTGHYACVLRRDGPPRWQRLPGTGPRAVWLDSDKTLAGRLLTALKDPTSSQTQRSDLIEALRQQRFVPLLPYLKAQGKLPAVRRLFVVPTGWMPLAPVEVLAPEYTVSYVPSGTLFARLRKTHRNLSASSLLALGDPVFALPKINRARPPKTGVLLTVVQKDGSAERAGLKEGDVLLQFGTKKVEKLADLIAALQAKEKPIVTYWRNGKEIKVTLAAGPLRIGIDRRTAPAAVRAWRDNEDLLRPRGENYAALPGTRFEVEALRKLVGEAKVTALLGSAASEQALDALTKKDKLKTFRILHLATHGRIDLERPERSALILSRDKLPDVNEQLRQGRKVYDGELRVGTILDDWNLDADLVVLSACSTGVGTQTSGDGLLGFTQALLQKQARSVLLSRWPVSDNATALLMLRFYENVLGKRKGLKKSMGRAAALHEAKKWLRELPRQEAEGLLVALTGGKLSATSVPRGTIDDIKGGKVKIPAVPKGDNPFAHPYFWAAFILTGDPD